MLKQLFNNKRAQNTAEYALLIALVVAGIIAMQTYAQRALQARVRDASSYMTSGVKDSSGNTIMGNTAQYEPYYMTSGYNVTRDAVSDKRLAEGTVAYDATTNRARVGGEATSYNGQLNGVQSGI